MRYVSVTELQPKLAKPSENRLMGHLYSSQRHHFGNISKTQRISEMPKKADLHRIRIEIASWILDV